MTTPRDAIGLSERLRYIAPEDDMPKTRKVMLEAATQLDALQARVKELEARPPLLDAKSLPSVDALVGALESRATRAEQERDEAYERAAKVAEGPIFKEKYRGGPGHNWFHIKQPGIDHDYGNGRLDAAAAIRRLSAGDEKEKK